jgi:NADH-quinone oxidoreductase subunit G
VALAPGDTFDDPYSYCVTDICPVGALTNRQFRFNERVWNLTKTDSICAGCARGCNISLQQRNGKIVRVMPRFNAKVNQYWMCDFGRDFYVNPAAERLKGTQIEGKPIQYNLFVQSVANLFKNHGTKIGMILSSHATHEELEAARKLCEKAGVQQIFKKADRTWQPGTGEIEQDDFLILADKTPNLRGLNQVFPKALELNQLNPAELAYLFVWGSNFSLELPKQVKVILLAATKEPLADQAHWRIAGRTPAEKNGSFTNADGLVQSFKCAVTRSESFDDFSFLSELIEKIS